MSGQTLKEKSARIADFYADTEVMFVPKVDAPAWTSEEDYLRNALERQEVPVRVYWLKEGRTTFVIPETYAQELDAVRHFRLGLEGSLDESSVPVGPLDPTFLRRALPEDFLDDLDTISTEGGSFRVRLLNEPNPMDPIFRQRTCNPDFVSQAATADDCITFFRKDVDEYLGDELRHEWAHIAYENEPSEVNAFQLALGLESERYYPRQRAAVNPEEYWAVLLGEEMLNPDLERLQELARRVPLQSVVLAHLLSSILSYRPSYKKEPDPAAADWRARVDYIEKNVAPAVWEKLLSAVRSDPASFAAQQTMRLLVRLEQGALLNDVPNLRSLDLSGAPVGWRHLKWLESNRTIEELDLSRTYIGYNPVEPLRNLPLQRLSLAGTGIMSSCIRCLREMQTLRDLDLSGTQLNISATSTLTKMTWLERLDLGGSGIEESSLEVVRKYLPQTVVES